MPPHAGWATAIRTQVVLMLLAAAGFVVTYLWFTVGASTTPGSQSARFVETDEFMIWVLLMGGQVAFLVFVGLPVWDWYRELATRNKRGRNHRRLLRRRAASARRSTGGRRRRKAVTYPRRSIRSRWPRRLTRRH